jgi:nitrogen-specific signal transduction histidine kinase
VSRQRSEASLVGGRPRDAQALATTVALVFGLVGTAWVLISDIVLYTWVHDPVLLARLETAKGWAFIALGSLLMYLVTAWSAKRFVRAQALNAAIVESIADGVLLLGRDRSVTYANPAAVEMLHAEEAGDLVGMGPAEFSRRFRVCYPDGSLVPPDQYVSQRVYDQGGTLRYTAILNPPGRPEVVVSCTAAAVHTTGGQSPAMVVSVVHDITTATHLEALRNQFFTAAAHALKTPVAIIKANVQVMVQRFDGELRRSMAAIERQCDRIDRLVQNLLVLARHQSRTLRLHQEDVELRPLIEQVVRDAQSAGIRMDMEMAGTPRVFADPERLTMALHNLVDAAARSSIAGTPMGVTVRHSDGDTQIGVRYQALPPAERAQELYGEYDEIGISRWVATMVVEAHGGSLVETEDDPETTFWVRLPIGVENDARHT